MFSDSKIIEFYCMDDDFLRDFIVTGKIYD